MSNHFTSSQSIDSDKIISVSFDRNDTEQLSFGFMFESGHDSHYREVIIHLNKICYKSFLDDEISTRIIGDKTFINNSGNNLLGKDFSIGQKLNQQNSYFVGKKDKNSTIFEFFNEIDDTKIDFNSLNTKEYSNSESITNITPVLLSSSSLWDDEECIILCSVNNEDITLLTSDHELSIPTNSGYSTIIIKEDSRIVDTRILPISENHIKITLEDNCKFVSIFQLKDNKFEKIGQFIFDSGRIQKQKIYPSFIFDGNYNISNIIYNF